jgi:lipopolysaccharide heptosyltransferase III
MTTPSPSCAAEDAASRPPRGAGAVLIHPGALGDVLLAVPALRALRAARPDEPVVIAAEPRLAALLRDLGEADQAVPLDALGLGALFTGDDVPPGSILRDARRVVCFMGARDPVFAARLAAMVPHVDVAPSAGREHPVWRHLVKTVDPRANPSLAPIRVSASLRQRGDALLRDAGRRGQTPLAIVHPGAGGDAKRWSAVGFARVVETLSERGLVVALHAGPADAVAVAAVTAAVRVPVLTLARPSLDALAGALASATIYLGNDSGISHLAAAVGAPAVVLFTEALRAWRPWSAAPHLVTIRPDVPDAGEIDAVLAGVASMLGGVAAVLGGVAAVRGDTRR